MMKTENQVCSDCPERQPRWASLIRPPPGSPPGALAIGAFCCLECSGSHRRLGVHISFVRSVNLDSWKEKEVLGMENGGNKKVNAIFEAVAQHANKPTTMSDGRTRERYIRDKYERRKFYDENVLLSYYNGDRGESEDDSSTDKEVKSKRSSTKKSAQSLRSPSDAAMKRAETRKSRLASTRNSVRSLVNDSINPKVQVDKTKVKQKTPTAPSTTSAEPIVDLLDFATPMSDPGPPPDPPSASPSPNLDLFKNMNKNSNLQNADPVSDSAAKAAMDPSAQRKTFNNDEILSMFNQPTPPQPAQMNFGNGMMAMNPNNMMAMNPNMMAMMQQQTQQNMAAMQMQQQQANMMAMMQQNNGSNMMMQPGMINPMMMNHPTTAAAGNMQQHLAMMNNLHIGNPKMMPSQQGNNNGHQMGIAQRPPEQSKQDKPDPFDAFGML